jgi:hypothetical protein
VRHTSAGGSQIGHPKSGRICMGNQQRADITKAAKGTKTARRIADDLPYQDEVRRESVASFFI